jgi:hypothetical protein
MHHVYHEWPSGPRIPSTSLVTTRSASRPSLGARITLDASDGAPAVTSATTGGLTDEQAGMTNSAASGHDRNVLRYRLARQDGPGFA